jgi:hypothetical protein
VRVDVELCACAVDLADEAGAVGGAVVGDVAAHVVGVGLEVVCYERLLGYVSGYARGIERLDICSVCSNALYSADV